MPRKSSDHVWRILAYALVKWWAKSLAAGLRIKSFSYQLTSQRYTAGLVCAQIKASLWFSLTPSLGPCCMEWRQVVAVTGQFLNSLDSKWRECSFRSFILSDLFLFSFSLDINVARYNVQQAPVASSMSVSVCACEIMHPLPNRIMRSINHGAFVILCSKPDLLHPIHQLSEVVWSLSLWAVKVDDLPSFDTSGRTLASRSWDFLALSAKKWRTRC